MNLASSEESPQTDDRAVLYQNFHNLLEALTKENLLIEDLVKSSPRSDTMTYLGVCRLTLTSKCRRIDIKVDGTDDRRLQMYSEKVRSFATLYFTGCSYFNRAMRLRARKLVI